MKSGRKKIIDTLAKKNHDRNLIFPMEKIIKNGMGKQHLIILYIINMDFLNMIILEQIK